MTTVKKPSDSILKLQKLVESMSPDEREALAQSGVNIPSGDLQAIAQRKFKFGLRCTHCNHISLYFVGEQWDIEGQPFDYPPAVAHWRVLWTQDLPPHEIDRSEPKCQNCRVPVPLNSDDSFRRDRKRIVLVVEWEATRDKAFKTGRKTALDAERGAAAHLGEIDQSYNTPNEPASKAIERLGLVNSTAELEHVAQASGAAAFRGLDTPQ